PRDVRAAKCLQHVLGPDDLAGARVKRRQIAATTERVNSIAVDCRCASRTIAAVVAKSRTVRSGPRFLSSRDIKRNDVLAIATKPHRVQLAVGDGERRVATSCACSFPDERRAISGPLLE